MTNETDRDWYRCCGRGLFVPLLLIGLGTVFLLDQYHVLAVNRAFDYFWPLVFICYGVDVLAWHPGRRRALWGVIAIAVGAALILKNLGYWSFDIARLWPVILIFFGLSLLFRGPRRLRRPRSFGAARFAAESSSGESQLEGTAVLGGIQRRITAQDFRGGALTAFFGGFNVDLTQANIAGEAAVLELSALFGGGEIRVPTAWIIDIQGHAFLGAYTDETRQTPPAAAAKRLIIQGTAIFGGVVIKN